MPLLFTSLPKKKKKSLEYLLQSTKNKEYLEKIKIGIKTIQAEKSI